MNQTPREEISDPRKLMYYGGMALSAIGLVTFLSIFLTALISMPAGNNIDQFRSGMQSFAIRGVLGIVMMAAGQGLRTAGARGLAGSGMVLDPEQARRDVEPWSRAAGGTLNDALEEVDVVKNLGHAASPPVVKIRCKSCQALNDEASKFCGQCGAQL